MSLPANNAGRSPEPSLIAGSVLPIQRAEELLTTLPGVISARIIASISGSVEEIHILTTAEITPKQTVRNVESALIAHLGMHVSHKKISVATSDEGVRPPRNTPGNADLYMSHLGGQTPAAAQPGQLIVPSTAPILRRKYYFEDVEVRRSRSKGITCKVTLRKGGETHVGEAEGMDNERLRIELSAKATLSAIKSAEGDAVLLLEGCKLVEAFDHQFVFVGVTTRLGRDTTLMTGTAEVRESPETSSVLAVLDATNRWLERTDR